MFSYGEPPAPAAPIFGGHPNYFNCCLALLPNQSPHCPVYSNEEFGMMSGSAVPGSSGPSGHSHNWRPTEEQLSVFNEWKAYCISHLVSCPDGINITRLLSTMREQTGEELPLAKMGLKSIYTFLYEMADSIEIRRKTVPSRFGPPRTELHVLVRETAIPDYCKHVRAMVLEQRRPKDEFGRKIKRIRDVTEYVPPIELLEEEDRRNSKCNWFYNYNQNQRFPSYYGGSNANPYQHPPLYQTRLFALTIDFPRQTYPYLAQPQPQFGGWTMPSQSLPGLMDYPAYPPQFEYGLQQQQRNRERLAPAPAPDVMPDVLPHSKPLLNVANQWNQPPTLSIKPNDTPQVAPQKTPSLDKGTPPPKPVINANTDVDSVKSLQDATKVDESRSKADELEPTGDGGHSVAAQTTTTTPELSQFGDSDHGQRTPQPMTSGVVDELMIWRTAAVQLELSKITSKFSQGWPDVMEWSLANETSQTASKADISRAGSKNDVPETETVPASKIDHEIKEEEKHTSSSAAPIKFEMDFNVNPRHMVDSFPYSTPSKADKVRLFDFKDKSSCAKLPSSVYDGQRFTLSLKAFMAHYYN